MKSEPVLIVIAAVQAAVVALVGLVFAFTHWTNAQQAAVSTAIQAVGAAVAIVLTRRQVFSPATVEALTGAPANPPADLGAPPAAKAVARKATAKKATKR